jgi:hypothetical protein
MRNCTINTEEGMALFKNFLSTTYNKLSPEQRQQYIDNYKVACLQDNHTKNNSQLSTKKHKLKKIHVYTDASTKDELRTMKGSELKGVLIQHNKNKNGSKNELVDRVWWILHPETDKPSKMEKGKRGRPSAPKLHNPAFIPDNSDEEVDDDNLQDLLEQYKTVEPITWNKIYTNSNKITTSGRVFYRYKTTKYIFKETIDSGYVPYGYVDDNKTISLLDLTQPSLFPTVLKNILAKSK